MPAHERSFAFEVLDDLELLLSYQGRNTPSDVEWSSYLQVLERLHRAPNGFRYLTLSEGGHPSTLQQSQVKAVIHGRTPPVAIVSSSIAIRFVGSFLALFNHRVQCFAPDQFDRALAHIGIEPVTTPRVLACLDKLKALVLTDSRAA